MATEPGMLSPYVVKSRQGFAPTNGHLVCMMTYTGTSPRHAVEGLGMDQLDHLLDDDANSIGMLLEHIAIVEEAYQVNTFGLHLSEEQKAHTRIGLDLGLSTQAYPRPRPRSLRGALIAGSSTDA